MNVFHKVTLAALKKNKTRTVATIIGIILSAAMICAVTTSVASFRNFLIEYSIYQDGDWYGAFSSANGAVLEDLRSSEEVEKLTYVKQLGYAVAEGCTNPDKPYLYVLGTSDNFNGMMPIHLTGGRYPTLENEILLPDHLLDNGGVAHKLGDTLTLEIGDRVSEGYTLNQHNPYRNAEDVTESLEVRETRTYTVVGFYERPGFEPYSAPGYTALTVDNGATEGTYDIYFKTEKAGDFYDYFYEILDKHGLSSGEANPNLLMYSGVSEFPEFQIVLYGIAAVVIALILFGAISLIYNAFSISVSERTKQFGLLSSVGATKKQIRKMVLFEAFAVSAIGIPLGVLAGIGGIGITFRFVGDLFTSMGIPKEVPLRMCVTWQSVVIACIIALVTVLISAWIPSRRATRVTAIDAIRQSKDIQVNPKALKTSKLTYRLFGLSGVIASKHYKRNKKKYRTTVISLFMSIVLFVSATSLVGYISDLVGLSYGTLGYDLVYFGDALGEDQDAETLSAKLNRADAVTAGTYYRRHISRVFVNRADVTQDYLEDYVDSYPDPELAAEGKVSFVANVIFVQDSEYRKLLSKHGLEESQYFNAERPLAIALNRYETYSEAKGKHSSGDILASSHVTVSSEFENTPEDYYVSGVYTDESGKQMCRLEHFYNAEDTYEAPYEEIYSVKQLEIGTFIDEAPYYVDDSAELRLIYPDSMASAVVGDWERQLSVVFVFKSDDHVKSYGKLCEILKENDLTDAHLWDYAAAVEDNRNLMMIINVFAYGFIALISLIAATNVFNTVSTGIALRRREFAMLRSVGMTEKGLNRMMNFECLLYGAKALLLGLPTSVVINFIIYKVVSRAMNVSFKLPWLAIGIAILSVFLVVFATMIYSMRKIKKENPIDALKNENL